MEEKNDKKSLIETFKQYDNVFVELSLELIEEDQNQPRKAFGLAKGGDHNRLLKSIKHYGIEDPIKVCQVEENRYVIMDGHRRFKCAKELKFEKVLCRVYPKMSEGEFEARRYEMQNNRRSWKPIEKANAIHRIKTEFSKEKYFIPDIVAHLNRREILSANGKRWDRSKIVKILTDETYIGTRIYNKRWGRLKQKSHSNPRSEWVVVPNAFESVIDEETFKKAKERLYWILPNIWRGGINAVKRAKKYIRTNIVQWLLSQEYSEFEAEKLVLELPIIFAIKIENRHLSQWCFLIDEKIRKFDNVFAVSVVPDRKQMLDDFFLLPVQNFTLTDYLILSKDSSAYYNYKIESDKIEKVVNLLIEELRKTKVKCGQSRERSIK